jgi:hypothetical protein
MTTRRLRGDIYDPREGEWVFDSSSLVNLDIAELLDLVRFNFAGRTHLVAEVCAEIDRGTTGPKVRIGNWFREEALPAGAQLKDYAALRTRWSSAPGRDAGEAASIVLAKAGRYGLVCDDGVGYSAARSWEGICVMRTVDLLVAMVRCNWVTGDAAWEAYSRLDSAGRSLGVVPWRDDSYVSHRQDFDQMCPARLGFDRCL